MAQRGIDSPASKQGNGFNGLRSSSCCLSLVTSRLKTILFPQTPQLPPLLISLGLLSMDKEDFFQHPRLMSYCAKGELRPKAVIFFSMVHVFNSSFDPMAALLCDTECIVAPLCIWFLYQ